MNGPASAALLALALSSSAHAAPETAPRPPVQDALAGVQLLFDQQDYGRVVGRLTEPEMQKLGRQDLRRAYDLLGQSYQRLGQQDRAIGVYQLAAQLFPKDLNLTTHLADILHHQELDDQARALYESALAIHPNNGSAHLGIAEIARATGLLEQSQEHYEKCLLEIKTDARVWRGYAEVLAKRRNYSKAADAIRKALELDPDNAPTLQSLAQFQRRQGKREEGYASLAAATAAADASPRHQDIRPELSLRKASWLFEDGRLDDSLQEAESVLLRFPNDPFALWLRARIALKRGDENAAAADLEAAASQSRSSPFAAAVAKGMLKELGGGQ
ncbi:MAG: tetratricopeptide repeat protein [Elusimicrobia bacterium]|nr:tetratricopeptide repeat protein [Elusimicrobiota bacterium]